MLRGFVGASANQFVLSTNRSMSDAIKVHNRDPFEDIQARQEYLPRLRNVMNQRLPFSTEDAIFNRHRIGVGNSSNIVINEDVYSDVAKKARDLDYEVGEMLYRMAEEIERMCNSIFIVPETAPRVMELTSQFKHLMTSFNGVTDDTIILVRRFVNEIIQIDEGH